VNQDSWRQRICPICGGKPDFAFLNKETGARWLICFRCDADWLFFHIECPFCGNQDQNSLAYLTDEKELYRLYTCEQYRTYIKAIDLRRAEGDVLFPLERILTLDLDKQAHKAGYKPGW
jgi:FdhE protein